MHRRLFAWPWHRCPDDATWVEGTVTIGVALGFLFGAMALGQALTGQP